MLNPPLFPQTGTDVKSFYPADGIDDADQSAYDDVMDSADALRRNLRALMDAVNDGLRSGPSGVLQLGAVTDIGKSTLYRILDPREKNPTQLDTLEQIAQAYGLQVWQLLVPRLDPLDPPEYIGKKRMDVLRSVFTQTQTTATQHEPDRPEQQDNTPGRATSTRSSDTTHRPHSSGRTSGEGKPAAKRRHKAPRA